MAIGSLCPLVAPRFGGKHNDHEDVDQNGNKELQIMVNTC